MNVESIDWNPRGHRTVPLVQRPPPPGRSHTGRFQPILDDALVTSIKAKYDLCLKQFGHLQTETIEAWQEIAAGVQQTIFSDGTQLWADFNRLELLVDSRPIPQPAGVN